MLRYNVLIFGLAIFIIALLVYVGPGEAIQNPSDLNRSLWADTSEIYPESQESSTRKKSPPWIVGTPL